MEFPPAQRVKKLRQLEATNKAESAKRTTRSWRSWASDHRPRGGQPSAHAWDV